MPNLSKKDKTLEELIMEINVKKMTEQNHKVNMQKFSKLIEYDEICDMTNKVFERRISSIEALLYEVFKS